MAEPEGRPKPPILERNGFQIVDGRFSVADIERIDGFCLRQLLNPEYCGLNFAAARELALMISKKDILIAQLKYYDIEFPTGATVLELCDILRDSVNQGKVSSHICIHSRSSA